MGFGWEDEDLAWAGKEERGARSHLLESLELRIRLLAPSDEAERLLGRAGVVEPSKVFGAQIPGTTGAQGRQQGEAKERVDETEDSGGSGLHRAGGVGLLDRINGICRIGIIRFTNDVSYEAIKRKIASFTRDDLVETSASLDTLPRANRSPMRRLGQSARDGIVPGRAHRPSGSTEA